MDGAADHPKGPADLSLKVPVLPGEAAEDLQREIWNATTDGALLIAAYGWVPTFHDAWITGARYELGADRMTLSVRYYDCTELTPDVDLRSAFEIVFTGDVRCDLQLWDNDIDGAHFQRTEAGYRFVVEPGCAQGEITSREIDIRLLALPDVPPDPGGHPLRFELV